MTLVDNTDLITFRQKEWLLLDKYRRHHFIKLEVKKQVLKALKENHHLDLTSRNLVSIRLTHVKTLASLNKQANRCLLSGRKHNVLQKVRYSRFFFRQEANLGSLPGVSRLSR